MSTRKPKCRLEGCDYTEFDDGYCVRHGVPGFGGRYFRLMFAAMQAKAKRMEHERVDYSTERRRYLECAVPEGTPGRWADGRMKEHRYVAQRERMANGGPPLRDGEDVHHVNGDYLDNRPENLVILPREEHIALHVSERQS